MVDELLSPLLSTPWGRRAGLGVLAFMGVLILITLIETVQTWHSDFKLTESHPEQHERSIQAHNLLTKLIAETPEWHLFGKYGVVEQSAILPVTSLQIRFVGIVKATPEELSRVIISESNQPGKVYKVGDKLSSYGVKIYAITPEEVVLDNAGRLEKLPLPRTPLTFQGMPKSLGE